MRGSIITFSTANSCPRDHRTTASGVLIRCSLGSLTMSESVSPGRIGKSQEGHRNLYYFTPTIMVPLRAPQAEAKRANAMK